MNSKFTYEIMSSLIAPCLMLSAGMSLTSTASFVASSIDIFVWIRYIVYMSIFVKGGLGDGKGFGVVFEMGIGLSGINE